MKKNHRNLLIPVAAMMAGIFVMNPLVHADETENIDTQLSLLTEDLKEGMETYNPDPSMVSFYITDFDQDGLLELNIETNVSPNWNTYQTRIYEVNEAMDGVTLLFDSGTDECPELDGFYDLEAGTRVLGAFTVTPMICYYDNENDTYYYLMYDYVHNGMHSDTTYYLVNLTDNTLETEILGTSAIDENGYTWAKADGTSLSSEEEMNAALRTYVENDVKCTFSILEFSGSHSGTYEENLKASADAWLSGLNAQ